MAATSPSPSPFPTAKGLTLLSHNKTQGGYVLKYSFAAKSFQGLKTTITIYLPPALNTATATRCPTLIYLAGLTCNDDTAPQKASTLIAAASEHGIAIVFPDTSPRGANIPGESEAWDFGVGAGFYLDATKAPWNSHWKMETFITNELLQVLLGSELPLRLDRDSLALIGHSMGGGPGALALYLKHPELFRCASAFAPIANPIECPWGKKAFEGYLVGGIEEGKRHDARHLLQKAGGEGRKVDILIDVGLDDKFNKDGQLLIENFEAAAKSAGYSADSVEVHYREGYDHSYFFVSTFARTHVAWHAKRLKA